MNLIMKSPINIIIIGVVAIAFAAYNYVDQKASLKDAAETTGTIIDIKESYSNSGTTTLKKRKHTNNSSKKTYKPVIKFETREGLFVQFTSVAGSTNKGKYNIEDKIAVLYDPVNPQNAQIKKENIQSKACIAGGAGLLFSMLGLGIMIFSKKND